MEWIKNIARSILSDEIASRKETIRVLTDDKTTLEMQNFALEGELVKDKDWQLSKKLVEAYPSKEITYRGRTFPNSTETCSVPINVLITKNDPRVIEDLEKWGFMGSNEDWETLIPKVYLKIREVYYRYAFDEKVWGKNEIWEFPFELFQKYKTGKISADCDSWAHFQMSYYRALGLPAGFGWVVVGNSKLGGHSTVYIYSKVDGRFHHLNSTYGKRFDKISEYPTHTDAHDTDVIGIYKVWYSFNDLVARSEFSELKLIKFLEENQ